MISRQIIFLKVFLCFSTLLCAAFIWERISPRGFDANYKVFTTALKDKPLLEVSSHLTDIAFKDDKHMGAFLMGDWDSIRTPLPKEALDISVNISADFYGSSPSGKSNSLPGLLVSQYKGCNLSGKPINSAVVPGFKLSNEPLVEPLLLPDSNSSFEWRGFLNVKTTGEYLFSLVADDGAFLFIDNVLVIRNQGPHAIVKVDRKLHLSQGEHSISLRYYNLYGWGTLDVKWANLSASEALGGMPNLKHFSEGDFTYREMGSQIDIRSKGDLLDYPLEGDRAFLFGVGEAGEGKVILKFPHITEMLGVEFYTMAPDRSYSKSGIFTFLRPSSSFSLWGSILSSLFCSLVIVFFVTLFSIKILKIRDLESLLYPISYCNIIVIAALARLNNLSNVPGFRYTYDEFMEAWMGINLIHLGKPTSWGWIQHIRSYSWIQFVGDSITYAEYQFHPPPLFGLIVGFWLKLFGVTSIYQFPVFLARLPSFFISMLVLFLLIRIVVHLANQQIALLAALFYAVFPANVVLNNLVKADNLLCLLALIVILLTRANLKVWGKLALCFCLALSPLTKEIGIYIPCAVFIYFALEKKYKLALVPIVGGFLGIASYLAYAYFINWDEFLFTIHAIENEGLNLNSIGRVMFEHELYALKYVMLVSWLGLFLFRNKNNYIILLFGFVYAVVYGIVSPGNFLWPWHQLCLFPYLAVGYGYLIDNSLFRFRGRTSNMFIALLSLLIVLPFLSEELNLVLSNLGLFQRRFCMLAIGTFLFSILFLVKRIPKSFYAIYCFILLTLAYLPFAYILIIKNYV